MDEIQNFIKKLIKENDYDGQTLDGNDEVIGVTPDVRLEYNAENDWWTASLSWDTLFDFSKVCSFWLNDDYEPAECGGKTVMEALTSLDLLCQEQRKQGAVLSA